MLLFKQKHWLIVLLSLVWPLTELNAETSEEQASEEVITVRPIGGLSGFVTETIQWKILELALQKSGQTYDLAPSSHKRLVGREADQMRELGNEGNIIWASPIYRQNAEILSVDIPFFRGLASYRYLWVADEGSQDLHDAVASGLNIAIADGSHDNLIRTFPYVGDAYTDLVSNDFVVIYIENPDLPVKAKNYLENYGVKVDG